MRGYSKICCMRRKKNPLKPASCVFTDALSQTLPNVFQYLGDIEDHLGVTIDQVDQDLKIPVNEFDGKVVYGAKLKSMGMYQRYPDTKFKFDRLLEMQFKLGMSFIYQIIT